MTNQKKTRVICAVVLALSASLALGQGHPTFGIPAPPVAAPPVAPPLTPEQMPPLPPEVTYVDGKLTIVSKNSTLSDILAAVRRLTGAQVDVLASTADERVAARLGPGPARDVLSSLLSSTDFDYVIQSSTANQQGILSVFLTPRGKEAQALVVAGNGMTAPKGGAAPAQSPVSAATAQPQPTNDGSQSAAVAPSSDNLVPSQPGDTVADASSASTQSSSSTDDSSLMPTPPEPVVATDRPVQPGIYPPPWVAQQEKIPPQLGSPAQMADQLQHMYQQRMQMQSPKPAPDATH